MTDYDDDDWFGGDLEPVTPDEPIHDEPAPEGLFGSAQQAPPTHAEKVAEPNPTRAPSPETPPEPSHRRETRTAAPTYTETAPEQHYEYENPTPDDELQTAEPMRTPEPARRKPAYADQHLTEDEHPRERSRRRNRSQGQREEKYYNDYEYDDDDAEDYYEDEGTDEDIDDDDEGGEGGKKSSFFSRYFPGKKEQLTEREIREKQEGKEKFSFTKENQIKIFRIVIWVVILLLLFMGLRQIIAPDKLSTTEVIDDVSAALNIPGFPEREAAIVGRDFVEAYLTVGTTEQQTERRETIQQLISPNVLASDFNVTVPNLTPEEVQQNTLPDGTVINPFEQRVIRGPYQVKPPIPVDPQGRLLTTVCDVRIQGQCRALFTYGATILNPNAQVVIPSQGNEPQPKPPETVYVSIPMVAVYSPQQGISVAVDGPVGFVQAPVEVLQSEKINIKYTTEGAATLIPELEGFFDAWAVSDVERMQRYLIEGQSAPSILEGLQGSVLLNTTQNAKTAFGENGVGSNEPVSNVVVEVFNDELPEGSPRLAAAQVQWLNPITGIVFSQKYTLNVIQASDGRWYILEVIGGEFK